MYCWECLVSLKLAELKQYSFWFLKNIAKLNITNAVVNFIFFDRILYSNLRGLCSRSVILSFSSTWQILEKWRCTYLLASFTYNNHKDWVGINKMRSNWLDLLGDLGRQLSWRLLNFYKEIIYWSKRTLFKSKRNFKILSNLI